jgi:hypothetical protein
VSKPRKKGAARKRVGGGSVRIDAILRDPIDVDKLAFVLLRVARERLAERSKQSSDSTSSNDDIMTPEGSDH